MTPALIEPFRGKASGKTVWFERFRRYPWLGFIPPFGFIAAWAGFRFPEDVEWHRR